MDLIKHLKPDVEACGTRVFTGIYYIIMEDCVQGFLDNGCEVLYPGVRKSVTDPQVMYSEEQFGETIRNGEFDVFFSINGDCLDNEGKTVEELVRNDKTIAVWYVDDPYNPFAPWFIDAKISEAHRGYEKTFIYAIDNTFVEKCKAAGFKNVYYLPHAASNNWANHKPEIDNPPTAPVTFINHLDLKNLKVFQDFLKEYPKEIQKRVKEFSERRKMQLTASWDEFLHNNQATDEVSLDDHRLRHIANRIAAINCRIHLIQILEPVGINVYGFEDWKEVLKNPESYKGNVPYYHGLASVYQQSAVTINLSHPQLVHGCNQRVLDVPAAGGFVINDYRKALREIYPGERLSTFTTPRELVSLVTGTIKDAVPRAKKIVTQQKIISDNHTFTHRMKELLNTLKK